MIMFATAFLSAHIPKEQAVSIQTPTYTLPLSVNIAAETAPADINGETSLGLITFFAFAYNSSKFIVYPLRVAFNVVLLVPSANLTQAFR
ncbi:hypothetical protein VCRA2126O85_210028 [Vibrio crassostreae]|nr:hypothetical protein VCRA2128O106_190062 [Vibrio crassostreae]CAK2683333.1 hypothetical protein VCRA2125O83_190062 [Vibrio crassostreae]CAK2741014.1 hypothetical protein VCRA2128O100_210028 [Vibrio crassostreae]CAK2749286.1 hypothetical protein VCRA2127O91_210062 [Vibrio crassostreae]CAK2750619.1 hypothetical protein VCRA2126O85_210028 [Vibrio crassostreae]